MTAPQPALIPPDPSVSGWYWMRNPGGSEAPKWWDADAASWYVPGSTLARWTPDFTAASGFTFASPTPRPILTTAQMDAVYALTADPKPPVMPASPFATGYHAGMEYAARKLREALEANQ